MPNFTTADVKRLRDLTGAGMMDTKKALEEADGDFDKATEILRIKGAKDVGKRAGRTAANGLVAHSGKSLLELNCETDFVAKNADVAKDVAQHIAAMMPRYVNRDEIPEETLANERRIAEETAREEGKPEKALPRIIEGRVNGFVKEVALVDQPFVRDNKKTVGAILTEAGVSVRRFARYRVGQA